MVIECDGGAVEFPRNLAYVLLDSYQSNVPQKTKCLGGRSVLLDDASVNVKVLMRDAFDSQVFLEWWVKELDFGVKPFSMNLMLFGVKKSWSVRSKSGLSESLLSQKTREVRMELIILDDIAQAVEDNILEVNYGN